MVFKIASSMLYRYRGEDPRHSVGPHKPITFKIHANTAGRHQNGKKMRWNEQLGPYTFTHSLSLIHTHTHSLTHSFSLTHSLSHLHTHTHTPTHTHTHTHTQSLPFYIIQVV